MPNIQDRTRDRNRRSPAPARRPPADALALYDDLKMLAESVEDVGQQAGRQGEREEPARAHYL